MYCLLLQIPSKQYSFSPASRHFQEPWNVAYIVSTHVHDSYTNSKMPCLLRTPRGTQTIQCTRIVDNDLEKTLHYFKKWNLGYVQRERNLRHTHRFSMYTIVILKPYFVRVATSTCVHFFLKEGDAVQPKHSLHLQIFVSFINQCYLFYILPAMALFDH